MRMRRRIQRRARVGRTMVAMTAGLRAAVVATERLGLVARQSNEAIREARER